MMIYHDDQIANPPWPDLSHPRLVRNPQKPHKTHWFQRCKGGAGEVQGEVLGGGGRCRGAGRRSGVMLLGRALGRRGLASSARLDPVQEALLAEKVLLLLLLLLL